MKNSSFLQAVRCSLTGFRALVREERNFRTQLAIAGMTLALATLLGCSVMEWCLLVLATGGVLITESVNSALERLGDAITRERHPLIGMAKDMGATAVFLAALTALTIGVMILVPKMLERLSFL